MENPDKLIIYWGTSNTTGRTFDDGTPNTAIYENVVMCNSRNIYKNIWSVIDNPMYWDDKLYLLRTGSHAAIGNELRDTYGSIGFIGVAEGNGYSDTFLPDYDAGEYIRRYDKLKTLLEYRQGRENLTFDAMWTTLTDASQGVDWDKATSYNQMKIIIQGIRGIVGQPNLPQIITYTHNQYDATNQSLMECIDLLYELNEDIGNVYIAGMPIALHDGGNHFDYPAYNTFGKWAAHICKGIWSGEGVTNSGKFKELTYLGDGTFQIETTTPDGVELVPYDFAGLDFFYMNGEDEIDIPILCNMIKGKYIETILDIADLPVDVDVKCRYLYGVFPDISNILTYNKFDSMPIDKTGTNWERDNCITVSNWGNQENVDDTINYRTFFGYMREKRNYVTCEWAVVDQNKYDNESDFNLKQLTAQKVYANALAQKKQARKALLNGTFDNASDISYWNNMIDSI